MTLDDLSTPCLVLDLASLERNLTAMRERMVHRGVVLRPHLKTAKSAEVARRAHGGRHGPITVSTLAEAEYFFDHGFVDMVYAVGILPTRLDRVAALAKRGARIAILTDNREAAEAIVSRAAQDDGSVFRVLLEIDSGEGRAGLRPDDPELIEIAGRLHRAAGVELVGVLTHAGHSYRCKTVPEIRAVAEEERSAAVRAAERLMAAGYPCPVVSVGSTPTAVHAENLDGVTEARPGVYMFNDLKQLSLGSCGREGLALSVLASVIGHNRRAGHLVLDAGALALSKDVSARETRPEVGYGEVCDVRTLAPCPGLYVAAVSQEHGLVPVPEPSWFDRMPIGAKVRIIPNHACITAAAYDRYHVVEGVAVVAEWPRTNGW